MDALAVIRENSVEGLAEMRRLIGILRDGSGDREPAASPTLDGLGALVDGARSNGLDVTLDAGHHSVPVPVELAAYRIVQESLTNALKHAAKGRVHVALRQEDGTLQVRVTSPYRPGDSPRAPGSGAGLTGMRERAALLGPVVKLPSAPRRHARSPKLIEQGGPPLAAPGESPSTSSTRPSARHSPKLCEQGVPPEHAPDAAGPPPGGRREFDDRT